MKILNGWKIVKPELSVSNSILTPSDIPPHHHQVIDKCDSTVSNHYWTLCDSYILDNVCDNDNGPSVTLLDKSTIAAIKQSSLTFSHLFLGMNLHACKSLLFWESL